MNKEEMVSQLLTIYFELREIADHLIAVSATRKSRLHGGRASELSSKAWMLNWIRVTRKRLDDFETFINENWQESNDN